MKAPVFFEVVRIRSLEIRVNVPDADKDMLSNTDATLVRQIQLDTYNNAGSIELDIVLNYKEGQVPRRADPERQLKFERAGAFEFDESRALIYRSSDQLPMVTLANDPPLEGTEYFDSGYLRHPPAALSSVPQPTPLRLRSAGQTVLSDSANGFFVVKANGPDAGPGSGCGRSARTRTRDSCSSSWRAKVGI